MILGNRTGAGGNDPAGNGPADRNRWNSDIDKSERVERLWYRVRNRRKFDSTLMDQVARSRPVMSVGMSARHKLSPLLASGVSDSGMESL